MSRRRKRQFTFETLEDRRVMSADSGVQLLSMPNGQQLQVQSYSSDTVEGQYQQLLSELYWQSLISESTGRSEMRSRSIPTDPLLAMQWHLINSGQQVGNPDFQPIYGVPGEDINVAPLWNQGYSGAGVVVAVIDSGVQTTHPDLVGNLNLALQFNSNTGQSNGNPVGVVGDPSVAHGTAVAGLIAAVANNGIGGAGVAPGATIVPINYLSGVQDPLGFVRALRFSIQNGVDITNNSFGPADIRQLGAPSAAELLALRDSVYEGRDGLGMINVWASGNGAGTYPFRPGFEGFLFGDSSNYDGFANSRYTIAVTGIDHDGSYNNVDGTVTNYMEAGANVLVAAPTGSVALTVGLDTGVGSGLITTDLTGEFGFNRLRDPITGEEFDRDFLNDPDYTSRFNGTSGAAPIAAGVIALMLEANPHLSWRDVQEILVRSARQNDPLGIPTNGAGIGTQNLWITNQVPIYHDPDIFSGDPFNDVYFPTLDPNLSAFGILAGNEPGATLVSFQDHWVGSPFQLTNGAGYTVSQGLGPYGELTGTGHGVIDAELAVRMAEQWHVKNQALPRDELSYTTFVNSPGNVPFDLPAAGVGSQESGFILVPGGIGGESGHIAYVNEYFVDDPDFTQDFPLRGLPSLEFAVPANNAMSIESIDVKVSIAGDSSSAMDHLRLLLISPTGTYSELNNYRVPSPAPFTTQFISLTNGMILFGEPGSIGPEGDFAWTFNTNRSWGERSDNAIMFDPLTGEPVVSSLGGVVLPPGFPPLPGQGEALTQGWRLVVENWSDVDLGLQGVEIVWHGRPVDANSQRVQGFVGVDDNRDDLFNFSRVIDTSLAAPGTTARLGDVSSTPDLTQESFAAGATVTVRRASDNVIVDQFITGHDGNFYFDLVPDNYIISVEDALGRAAVDDTLTPEGLLDHYRSEWHITTDYFRVWDHDPLFPTEVLTDANGDPLPWFDQSELPKTVTYGMTGINFLLDPGEAPAQQAEFHGSVFADVNGDGVYNGDDVYLPSVIVFGDVNRNGQRDPGEVTTQTDANGNYTLVVPMTTASVMNVGVAPPTNWTATKPVTSSDPNALFFTRFAGPGSEFDLADFALKPPANNIGGGTAAQSGFLLGVVYNDANANGNRQAGEAGIPGITVFIDANNSGVVDAGDTVTTTNEHGAYVFTNVAPGQKLVRAVVNSPLVQTAPVPGVGRVVTLTGSSTISNIQFGIRSLAKDDFGDLPAIYGATTLAQNGARHRVGGYYLGAPGSNAVDAELDGIPSVDANGDDTTGFDDEDGISFGALVPGGTTQLVIQASQSGFLQGWIDWNDDGDFNDVGERVFTNEGLIAGANQKLISVPAGANVAQVYARFRFGAPDLGVNGAASFGEVEDYRLTVDVPVLPPVRGQAGDADGDGDVDGNDFLVWQRNLGKTSGATQAQGDATGDGRVDAADLAVWKSEHGSGAAAVMIPATGDFDGDGDVDGNDFLQMQRGLGLGHPTVGDGNRDGVVNGDDLAVWGQQYGTQSAAAASASFEVSAAASTVVSSSLRSAWPTTPPSVGVTGNLDASSTVAGELRIREAFAGRPFVDVAGRVDALRDLIASLAGDVRDRVEDVRDEIKERIADTKERWLPEDWSDRRDRAFDDLFGTRRRQGLRVDADPADEGDDAECDEAFAMFADHVQVPV